METINMYTVKNGGDLLFAYSKERFAPGESVKVTYRSRFDGVQKLCGTISSAQIVEIRDGMLKSIITGKYDQRIGTIQIERVN